MLFNFKKFIIKTQDRVGETHIYKVRSQKVLWGKYLLQSEYTEFYTVSIIHIKRSQSSAMKKC